MRSALLSLLLLAIFLLSVSCVPLYAGDVWDEPPFSASPAALRQAADSITPSKDHGATLVLNEESLTFDSTGRVLDVRHRIYRIETKEGVDGWSEVSLRWAPWHQSKPVIRARVITPDGSVHTLDPETLEDLPVHTDSPEVYSDERRYGGPLPAIAPGAIVEEEVTLKDTESFFAAGTAEGRTFGWYVPVHKTRLVLNYPKSSPVRYKLWLLPDVSVRKVTSNDSETVILEQGPLPAYTEYLDHVPPDVVLYPVVEFTTGTTWQAVASEYARLVDEKLRLGDVETLMSKVNTKESSREEIIRRIVSELHRNVRYTGVEFGESQLIPQFPAETLKRKYGDCKDKAALLVAMLRSAGISADLALLNEGSGLDIDPDLPGMGVFNHAIVYVPPAGSDSALWIDATAQYAQVGTLPWGDYGRRALIVSATTDGLTTTPDLTYAQVIHRELREFTLAEYGPAHIVEIDQDIGPGDSDSREYYSGDAKELRKRAERYVQDTYLAESLTALELGDPANLEKPATVKYVATGRRGFTSLDSAIMVIRTEALFGDLPRYFRTAQPKPPAGTHAEDAEKPRTADWWIRPFTTEWQYTIKAPLGFKVRALPPPSSEKIGTLSFTQKYSSNSEGNIVEAILRLSNDKQRLTADEGRQLRDAVVKAIDRDPIVITFDHAGDALLASGKVKEGLAVYRQIAAQHPTEALHEAQLARALLAVGLGESARTTAREATKLDANSFIAYKTLAQVLQCDLIGRPFKKGMDYPDAVAAYKKSITLDPKDKEARADLALLLEYDAGGTRYANPESLKEAIGVLRDLKKIDEDYERKYEDSALYDLWYAHDYSGLLEYSGHLPSSETRKGLIIAATAVEAGSDTALKKSLEATTDDQSRKKVLSNAAVWLVGARKYPEAAALLAEAAKGQSNENQSRGVAVLSRTKPYTDVKLDPADPRSVVYRLFGQMLSGNLTLKELKSLVYIDPENASESMDEKEFATMMSRIRIQSANGALVPQVTLADIAVSNMHCSLEGDDASGYRVTVESPGVPPQELFVIRDADTYKIAAFSAGSNSTHTEDLAWQVLRQLRKNDLVGARIWLDRARERIHVSTGDDPLSGAVFPQFWTKGQDADAATMRTAALVLMPAKAAGAYLSELKQAREAAKSEAERTRLTLVIADADSATKRWDDLLVESQQLLKTAPSSVRAFNLMSTAYQQLKRYDDWDRLLQEKMKQYPDELTYTRWAAALAWNRGEVEKSRSIVKGIIDKGKAVAFDFNQYAWYTLLLPGPISDETLELAHRAQDLNGNNFAVLELLGCVYAQAGKTGQARDYLLKALDAAQLEEPRSEMWFGFGLIAEQYGVIDAAEGMYRHVEKPDMDYPGSFYALAQQHLATLQRTSPGIQASSKR